MKKRSSIMLLSALCALIIGAVFAFYTVGRTSSSARADSDTRVIWSFDDFHAVVASGSGVHLYARANIGNDALLQPVGIHDNVFAFRTSDGHYLTVNDDGTLGASATDYSSARQQFNIILHSNASCSFSPFAAPTQIAGKASVQTSFDGRFLNVHHEEANAPVFADSVSEVQINVFSEGLLSQGCGLPPVA